METLSKVSVVLPSLDPDEKLLRVVDGLLAAGFDDIILINDGSKQENLHYFETAARYPQVQLLHHPHNRGKGAALKTGFAWFLKNRPDRLGVVTVDGDNQHYPDDTTACSLHMLQTGRITLGVRDFSLPQVPRRSRWGNRITSFVFKVFVGMTLSDTQTGLRAFPVSVLQTMLQVTGDRFEYETNMLLEMKAGQIPFEEVKIRTVYIEENKSSHFHAVRDSWRIYKLILRHFFCYTLSSLSSAVLDAGIFSLLTYLLSPVLTGFALTAVPGVTARAVSALFNFFVNKKLVFRSKGPTGRALRRYIFLAVLIMGLQVLLTHGVYLLFGISAGQTVLRGVIYAVVMTALFGLSYTVQQRWVFAREKEKTYEN